mmetsp:Transcript_13478/g.39362  ORF Transcript_13478/g.39362 Transcript_13478/m.39362 type:complete len:240 (+) Transcript_13478:772-1491(+)
MQPDLPPPSPAEKAPRRKTVSFCLLRRSPRRQLDQGCHHQEHVQNLNEQHGTVHPPLEIPRTVQDVPQKHQAVQDAPQAFRPEDEFPLVRQLLPSREGIPRGGGGVPGEARPEEAGGEESHGIRLRRVAEKGDQTALGPEEEGGRRAQEHSRRPGDGGNCRGDTVDSGRMTLSMLATMIRFGGRPIVGSGIRGQRHHHNQQQVRSGEDGERRIVERVVRRHRSLTKQREGKNGGEGSNF